MSNIKINLPSGYSFDTTEDKLPELCPSCGYSWKEGIDSIKNGNQYDFYQAMCIIANCTVCKAHLWEMVQDRVTKGIQTEGMIRCQLVDDWQRGMRG